MSEQGISHVIDGFCPRLNGVGQLLMDLPGLTRKAQAGARTCRLGQEAPSRLGTPPPRSGPLLTCALCNGEMAASSHFCPGCGAPGPEATADERLAWRDRRAAVAAGAPAATQSAPPWTLPAAQPSPPPVSPLPAWSQPQPGPATPAPP